MTRSTQGAAIRGDQEPPETPPYWGRNRIREFWWFFLRRDIVPVGAVRWDNVGPDIGPYVSWPCRPRDPQRSGTRLKRNRLVGPFNPLGQII
ncbi:UNVERIFIED_CONTAM: hypothetical protein Sangu_1107300 [Sesamum angustifolium]|uniref:Uncharacterized protein n=1 Tax=Sesamum angustifolium TaxID=2727405 RepID=A0AAW2NY16_9LAMI